MKGILKTIFFLLSISTASAQIREQDTLKMGYVLTDKDTILSNPIMLEEVVIENKKLDAAARKAYISLQKSVLVAYPFAKIAAERLTTLNKNLALLQSSRDKKKYLKIIDSYLENEFTERLKKLSQKQGQILIKLIYRQTGIATFDIIKNYKSNWKAFWSNQTAHFFNLNLKAEYHPYDINEDYLIESILQKFFDRGVLANQPPHQPIDFEDLTSFWSKKQ